MSRTEAENEEEERIVVRWWTREGVLWTMVVTTTLVGLGVGALSGYGRRVVSAGPWWGDKALHGIVHGVLVVSVSKAWKIRTMAGKLGVWGASVSLGIVVELAQEWVTQDRHADFGDVVAACVGSCVGSCVASARVDGKLVHKGPPPKLSDPLPAPQHTERRGTGVQMV